MINQTALIIAVPHPNARGAIQDGVTIAEHLLYKGWTVTLVSDADATIHNVMSRKADVFWFTGECTSENRIQLSDGVLAPRLLAIGKPLTVFDCCHIGSLIKPDGSSPVVCASSGLNWNETDGSSLFMHAVRHIIKDANPDTPLLDPIAPKMPVETFRRIAIWMSIWSDRNQPTQRQLPVMGKL